MSGYLARAKANRAMKHNSPPSSDQTYQPGDDVLVWREKQVENRIGEWLGPYKVVAVDVTSKILAVQKDEQSTLERFNLTQAKPFLRPQETAESFFSTISCFFNVLVQQPQYSRKYEALSEDTRYAIGIGKECSNFKTTSARALLTFLFLPLPRYSSRNLSTETAHAPHALK